MTRQRGWRLIVKKAFDKTAAGGALLLFAPLIGTTAAIIRVTMGRPVLFRQERPGLYGRPFTLMKFRTMADLRNEAGELQPDGLRITWLGKLLRATSLDELPQLWNVFCGDMSLVGPRPLLMAYLERYSPEQMRRCDVLPGITGWAQINGRNTLTWEEKFKHDVWYVEHWSLWLDAHILARTLVRVLRREGISMDGHSTMPEFLGSAFR